jgi:WhiB family redox-sensing transcriptional regulator
MTPPFAEYDPDWMVHAACKGKDSSVFYFEDTSPNHEARQLCISCPVRLDCLEYATEHEKDWGVWAGLTARVRLTLRRLRQQTGSSSVQEMLAVRPEAVLEAYPPPRRTYRRSPDKPYPISTNEMFQSLIEAARVRYGNQSKR